MQQNLCLPKPTLSWGHGFEDEIRDGQSVDMHNAQTQLVRWAQLDHAASKGLQTRLQFA